MYTLLEFLALFPAFRTLPKPVLVADGAEYSLCALAVTGFALVRFLSLTPDASNFFGTVDSAGAEVTLDPRYHFGLSVGAFPAAPRARNLAVPFASGT